MTIVRQWILRGVGLAVALLFLVVAAQLILLGFEGSPLIGRALLDDVTSWMRRRPVVGAGLVAGMILIVSSVGLWWAIARSFGLDRPVITVRTHEGWTKLDRPTLAAAIERDLGSVDSRTDISASIGRGGSTRLAITTLDATAAGPVDDVRNRFADLCRERALPCQLERMTVSAPRPGSGRKRVR